MENTRFLVTTPLYYPSGNLHLGHAWTTLLADVFNRYYKSKKINTLFLTGIDEHGSKIARIALRKKISPQCYVDQMHREYQSFWKKLKINYDVLVRTSDRQHTKVVQTIFRQLKDQNRIYDGRYRGLYCNQCEEFLTPVQLNNHICRVCQTKPELITEPTYFLKTRDDSAWLLQILRSSVKLIKPEYVNLELIKNFLASNQLQDLSVTRSDVKWGCVVPDDRGQTIYVWFDALIGYLSGIGFLDPNAQFSEWWHDHTNILQIIGKEIVRFHGIYWPMLLKNLNLRLPSKILTHSWITVEKLKMSKSLHNSVDPTILIERYSAPALRCFLFCRMKIKTDNLYSHQLFLEFYNYFLVNSLGNLHSRITTMVIKYFAGQIPTSDSKQWGLLKTQILTKTKQFIHQMDRYQVFAAAQLVIELVDDCNKAIEMQKPWLLFGNNVTALKNVIGCLGYGLAIIAFLLKPVLLNKSDQILQDLGLDVNLSWSQMLDPHVIFRSNGVQKTKLLFKKIDVKKEIVFLNAELV